MEINGNSMGAVDNLFNLSGRRGSVFVDFRDLSTEERGAFLSVTAGLLKQGIVGNETLKVNGRPYTTDVTTRLGDERLRRAPIYRGPAQGTTVDLRA